MKKLATIISRAGDSTILSLFVFYLLARVETDPISAIYWTLISFSLVALIPLIYILSGLKRGTISGFDLPLKEERLGMIRISILADFLAYWLIYFLGGPALHLALLATYFFLGITMYAITRYWRISLHMVGVSGFATVLLIIFNLYWPILFLPVMGWARLYLKRHDIYQVIAGATLSALITAAIFILGKGFIY